MKYLYSMLLFVAPFFCNSQDHILVKIPLSEQVSSAKAIVEGKVIAKKSYWDTGKKNIYTVHTIDISKSYKGKSQQQLYIVTQGGALGLKVVVTHPNLSLEKDAAGVFIVENFPLQLEGFNSTVHLFRTIGVSQGFYRYDKSNANVSNPFTSFNSYKVLDKTLKSLTQQEPKKLKALNYFEPKKTNSNKCCCYNKLHKSDSNSGRK